MHPAIALPSLPASSDRPEQPLATASTACRSIRVGPRRRETPATSDEASTAWKARAEENTTALETLSRTSQSTKRTQTPRTCHTGPLPKNNTAQTAPRHYCHLHTVTNRTQATPLQFLHAQPDAKDTPSIPNPTSRTETRNTLLCYY